MQSFRLLLVALVLSAGAALAATPTRTPTSTPTQTPTLTPTYCGDHNPLKNAYYGDLHSHTSYSLDAYNFGTRTDPVSAYAFATGAAVNIAEGYDASKGQVPGPNGVTISFTGGHLDFLGLTDHSEFLSSDYGCTYDTNSPFYQSPLCDANASLLAAKPTPRPCNGFTNGTATGCQQEQSKAWQAEIAATTSAYQPCTFTTFHAFEWTKGTTTLTNKETLHKNVFFNGETVPALPLDAYDYPTAPELWAGLAAQCLASQGCEALTIPHNGNMSGGQAFNVAGYTSAEFDLMMQYQKLVEIHQHKGNSECLTDTADTGAVTACDFEVDPNDALPADLPGYVRPGIEAGITTLAASGFNPLQMGFVGATDNHDGTPGNVGESTWPGFIGAIDNTPELRLQDATNNKRNPGGITGVWAEENTRESIWAALQRRETFATSGPRIAVRFYGYTNIANPCGDSNFPAQLVASAVPMGGTLPHQGTAPSFVVYAMQDQAKLAAVDIVKASIVNGAAVESVHTISLPANPPYCVTWSDPAFVPDHPALYYARVKEVPTWRWSHYDCQRLKLSNPSDWQTIAPGCASSDPSTGGLDVMIQERAWASPIWYLASAASTPTSTATPSTATPTASATATSAPIPTATHTVTATASHTPITTPTPTRTATRTATGMPTQTNTAAATPAPCVGDCNGDGQVTVDEILTMVNIALGNALVTACAAGDANHDGQITVDEVLAAVNNALNGCAAAQGITFSVGPDEAPTYPSDLTILPDEHTTFIPPAAGSDTYLVFAAAFSVDSDGPVVLETKDLQTFTLAAGYTQPVMSPPLPFITCKAFYDPEFDLNYAAPGLVVQDPTQPPGNLIMIYEAENHCPGGVWQQPFYVTVGFTRSPDNGKTWPPPVDSEMGGPDRYPVLKISTREPTTPEPTPIPLGDALPSGFVDVGNKLYVTYTYVGPGGDGFARVARATLGGGGQVSFSKWYNGAFSEPGLGGLDSGVLPAHGCVGYQNMAQISYNDALSVYLITFVCVSLQKDAGGTLQPYQAAWYFSTATSLDSQNWTAPQLIENSQFPVTLGCGIQSNGRMFDGWYPSFVSPGSAAGHLSTSGRVFFMNGCDIGKRTFASRTFTITGPGLK